MTPGDSVVVHTRYGGLGDVLAVMGWAVVVLWIAGGLYAHALQWWRAQRKGR